jgi:uncharacterized protein (TIGR03437 family)
MSLLRADPFPSNRLLHRKQENSMRRMPFIVGCAILMSLGPMFGQGITQSGTGYSDPAIVHVAPGQITTLFVTGLKTVLSSQPVNATSIPLPTTLAGITVTLNQAGSQPTPVPLLSIQQMSVCSNAGAPPPASGLTADCFITAITVQIPFELVLPGGDRPPIVAELAVGENGNVSKAFKVVPVTDNLHIMNTCDVFPSPKVIQVSQPISSSAPPCASLVTHANGDLITADDPAKSGEEVVIWAFGLGQTSPAVKTGQASPTPAATLSSFLFLQFDFRPNATPSRPYINPLILAPIPTPVPVFAGLTPGQVGLYQINVRIPNSIPALGSCTTGAQSISPYNTVQSNLTIDLGATTSFDGAAICVQPPQ